MRIFYLIGFVSVIIVNVVFNLLINSDPMGLHHRSYSWIALCAWVIFGTMLCAYWMPIKKCVTSLICGFMGGAIFASVIDALSNSMVVHNQFFIKSGQTNGVYFNLTDVIMWYSFFYIVGATFYLILKERSNLKCLIKGEKVQTHQ